MTRFGHHGLTRLEELLRRDRPQPPPALEERLTTFVEHQSRRRFAVPRVALAIALSVGTLAAVGSLVGVGQAASGPQQVVAAVVHVLTVSTSNSSQNDKGGKDEKGGKGGGGGGGGGDHGGGGGGGGNGGHEGDDDPSHDQYKPGKGCGDDNHVHSRENQCNNDDHKDNKKR